MSDYIMCPKCREWLSHPHEHDYSCYTITTPINDEDINPTFPQLEGSWVRKEKYDTLRKQLELAVEALKDLEQGDFRKTVSRMYWMVAKAALAEIERIGCTKC
jgi:hypothetical protein